MGWDTEDSHYIDIANRLTQTYADYRISCRYRPRGGFGEDPGPAEVWAACNEHAREDFTRACKRAVEAELWATQIAEAAGASVEDIVYDLNEAGLKLPWTDDWPHWGDAQEHTECRRGLRYSWFAMAMAKLKLDYETEPASVKARQGTYEALVEILRDRLREAAALQVAVRPILEAAGCTYDELLPHLLAIGYTQTYGKDDGKRVTTISLAEPVEICTWCDMPAKYCPCQAG